MKYLFIILIAVISLYSSTEKKDTLTIINCDTIKIVRIIRDTSVVVKQDTLKTELPKPEKTNKKK